MRKEKKENEKMKSRKFGIGLLVMLAFVVTTGTFAYWASGVAEPADEVVTETITIGEGNEVTTSIDLTNNSTLGTLVPANQSGNSVGTTVESITLSYNILWEEDGTQTQLADTTTTGVITATPIVTVTTGGNDVTATVGSLVVVTPGGSNPSSITLDGSAAIFTYTVTLTEPTTQAQYDDLATGEIEIEITWVIDNVVTTDN
jgi:hypothetical protein